MKESNTKTGTHTTAHKGECNSSMGGCATDKTKAKSTTKTEAKKSGK